MQHRSTQWDILLRQVSSGGSTLATQTIAETGSTSSIGVAIVSGAAGDAYQINYRVNAPPTLSHYLANGVLDTSFGMSGYTTIQPAESTGLLNAPQMQLVRQADGKLLVYTLGAVTIGAPVDIYLFRINTNGTFDSTFGTGGLAKVDYGYNDIPMTLVPMSDGGLVVASRVTLSPTVSTALNFTRLRANGTLDPTFGTGGKLTVTTVFAQPILSSMFVLGSVITAFGQVNERPYVVKVSTAGVLISGPQWVDAANGWTIEGSVAQRAGGYVATFIQNGSGNLVRGVALLDANGLLKDTPNTYNSSVLTGYTYLGLSDGRVMNVSDRSTSPTAGPAEVTVTMFKSDGTLDTTFGAAGQAIVTRALTDPGTIGLGQIAFTPVGDVLVSGSVNLTGSTRLSDSAVLKVDVLSTPPAATASLAGYTFNDSNANGILDTSESKAGGKIVFVDSNNNGKLDAGERSVVTGTDGSFSFSGLAAGTYHVRRVFPSGYTYSTQLIDIVLAAGQAASGLAIGSKTV